MKPIIVCLVATLVATPTFANDFSGKSGGCNALLCSSRRVVDLDNHVRGLSTRHQNNGAVKDLSTKVLQRKSAAAKRTELVRFFAFTDAMDATEMEKQVERRLNDGQADKVSNADVRKLVDILNGENE